MMPSWLRSGERLIRRLFNRALIDVGSLALGLAIFIVLAIFVRFETSYEHWFGSADDVVQVRSIWTLPGTPEQASPTTMGGLLDQMQGDFSGLVGTRVWAADAVVRTGAQAASEPVGIVDPAFFAVFDWPLVSGDRASALAGPDRLVVSETIARRYFGTADAVGRTITLGVNGDIATYRVSAVMKDVPRNSMFNASASADVRVSMLLPISYDPEDQPNWYRWGSEQLRTYLRFPDPAAARQFEAGLPAFIDRHAPASDGVPMRTILTFELLPLREVHLVEPADRAVVTTLGLVGLLTLLVAIINYVNLATARAALRAREVAMRKVLGATRAQLVVHFMGEAVITVALAAILGLAIAELALPFLNALSGTVLAVHYVGSDGVLLPLLLLVIVVGGLAGIYPALVLSRFHPATVLASARTPAGGRGGVLLREALVALQFSVAIAFAIGTSVLLAQANHVREADLGFRRDGLVIVPSFKDAGLEPAQRSTVLAAFRTVPGVIAVTQSDSAAGDASTTNSMNIPRPDGIKPDPILTWTVVGQDYFKTYGARLVAGRALGGGFGADDQKSGSGSRSAVLNRKAVAALGFSSAEAAIGRTVRSSGPVMVVGVIDDMRFRSPQQPVPPMLYFFRPDGLDDPIAAVRFHGTDTATLIARLRMAWQLIAPDVPFNVVTAEANIAEAYWHQDEQRSILFAMGAGLAVLIGCIGLYGLASFSAARRVREVGIRKTLGATSADIARLLIGQFLRPIFVANFVAWPVAFVATRSWLANFDDRISLGLAYFVVATAVTLLVAVVTILGQTLSVARARPATALRHE